jgi:uncharacterized SAM-binding protein YcdF (DUF218 family)
LGSVSNRTGAVAGPSRQGCARLGLFGLLAVLLLAVPLLYLGLRGLGAYLITVDRLKQANAVVVLGGGGEHRAEEAARLVVDGYGAWLIITEPGPLGDGAGLGSDAFRQAAIENGVSPFEILITERAARSTFEEAVAVRQLMKQRQFQSIIVVTDSFHTQRTRIIFRDVFRGSGLSVRVHPAPGSQYRSTTWFLSRSGWGHTIREYSKLFFYRTGMNRLVD